MSKPERSGKIACAVCTKFKGTIEEFVVHVGPDMPNEFAADLQLERQHKLTGGTLYFYHDYNSLDPKSFLWEKISWDEGNEREVALKYIRGLLVITMISEPGNPFVFVCNACDARRTVAVSKILIMKEEAVLENMILETRRSRLSYRRSIELKEVDIEELKKNIFSTRQDEQRLEEKLKELN